MDYPIKMIVTDLDGTLLLSDKTISERTIAILNKCREMGIKLVYATGRGGSAESLTSTALFDGKITMNGAIVKVEDTLVHSRLIPYQIARPLLVACDNRGLCIVSETGNIHYSNFVVSDVWPAFTNFEIVDFSHHNMDAEKIYLTKLTPEDEKFVEEQLPDSLYMVVAQADDLVMIMHKEASKSKGISVLAHMWGIAPCEIVAFGDDMNDIDMLSYAGIGVAMGNAREELKAVSNFVCLSNDDNGLAEWLSENVLCTRFTKKAVAN